MPTNNTPQSNQTTPTRTVDRLTLGQQMRDLRHKLQCTQQEMAKTLGVLPGYVGHIEVGYGGYNLERACALVQRAYQEFGVPYPSAPPTQVAPGEVEREALHRNARSLAQSVAQQVEAFEKEFRPSREELAALCGISLAHMYRVRSEREGVSRDTLQGVQRALSAETSRRRSATPVPAVVTAPTPTITPAAAAPAQATGATVNPKEKSVVVREAQLLSAISFDYTTAHRFMKLPDGQILVVKVA